MARGWAGSTCYRQPARLTSGRECYDVALAPFNQRQHVLAPARQRGLHLVPVRTTIVNSSDAAAVTAMVIEHCLDHVRVDLDVTHAGGDGAAEIAQLPRLHLAVEPAIERVLAMAPFSKTAR